MKSFRSTLLFALIVGAVVGYAIFEMKRGEEKVAKEAKQDRLFSLEEKDLQEFQIVRPEGTLHLVREQDTLKLTAPVEDRTDGFLATSFVNSILNQTGKVLEEKNQQWAEYGLENTPYRVEVTSKKGDKKTYLVGTEQAFDGSYYLRDGERLLLGTSSWKSFLTKAANDIRDKKLFNFGDRVKEVRINSRELKLVHQNNKDESKWVNEDHPQWVLSESEVDRFITDLTNYRANDFVAEDVTQETLKKFGLNQPQLTVEIGLENEKSEGPHWWLKAVHPKTSPKEVYAIVKGGKAIYKLASDTLQKLNPSSDTFRDKKVPFQFKTDDVRKISLRTQTTDLNLEKKNDQWVSVKELADKEVDQEAVRNLLNQTLGIEAKYFLTTQKKASSLGRKVSSLELSGNDGKPLLLIKWGDTFKAKKEVKEATSDEDLYYVQTSLVPELMGVPVSKINSLSTQTLLKEKKKPSEPPASTAPMTPLTSDSEKNHEDKHK